MSAKNRKKQNTKVKPKKVRFTFSRILRFCKIGLLSITLFVIAGASLFYGAKAAQQFLSKPITQWVIDGEFNYLNKVAVEAMLQEQVQNSFIKESLVTIQKNIEKHPWVDTAVLRRQWPDRLHVYITEQKPIARWGQSGFVNFRGELFEVSDSDQRKKNQLSDVVDDNKITALPVLYGEESNTLELMKQYQLLSEIVAPYGLSISQLTENALGIWTFSLNNGWEFIAGRDAIAKKLQRVMAMFASNKIHRQNDVSQIDMRYENGLAIRWKTTEQHAQSDRDDSIVVKNNI